MNTTIKNWFIVDVYTNSKFEKHLGKILWGVVVNDEQGRFELDDYVCTSTLLEIKPSVREVYTRTGSIYVLDGPGELVRLTHDELAIISKGISPSELANIKVEFQSANEL
ncbi:hypothetical protein [Moritella viscosa]|uniref:hypothetical protein n=1 Tax=Moritella viscosa TaxID=80854 RepID=UPI00091B078A|nr:hypothetical protein [Moritella viscosa]SGZ02108.1 Magnesium transporter [Moritella viscosa]